MPVPGTVIVTVVAGSVTVTAGCVTVTGWVTVWVVVTVDPAASGS